jgi:hypothetical protein
MYGPMMLREPSSVQSAIAHLRWSAIAGFTAFG